MVSDQNTAATPSQAMITSNALLETNPVTTMPASPAVTRSLDLEFKAEGPPPGFTGTSALSSGTMAAYLFSYSSLQFRSVEPTTTNANVFTPTSTTSAQTIRHSTTPVITSASSSTTIPQVSTTQYYQPSVTYAMPPLYSAALTAALSTPPHQPVVMPTGIMNAPVTPGNQAYFPGYYYEPPYGYLPPYNTPTYTPQGAAQGYAQQSPYAAYMPPWWTFPTSQPVYSQTPPTAEPVYDRGNTSRPRFSPDEGPSPTLNITSAQPQVTQGTIQGGAPPPI
ncbi:extensin-like [Helianthus annuus]|uniref:extensin-like n=1 Tax=Helianthus annuus TaxID=4232 RepID=UPI000B8FBDDC|nr:extensin-like [Helianthus annuus]